MSTAGAMRAPRLRTIATCLALAVAVCACRSQAPPPQPARWAHAWIAAMNSHRLEDFDGLLKPTGTYEDPLTRGPRSGPALAYFLVVWWRAFPASHFTLQRATGDGNVAVAEWTATGLGPETGTKPLAGVFVIQRQGDAIASVRGYYDASALGALIPGDGRRADTASATGQATPPVVPRP